MLKANKLMKDSTDKDALIALLESDDQPTYELREQYQNNQQSKIDRATMTNEGTSTGDSESQKYLNAYLAYDVSQQDCFLENDEDDLDADNDCGEVGDSDESGKIAASNSDSETRLNTKDPLLVFWPPVKSQKRIPGQSPLVLSSDENFTICIAQVDVDVYPLLEYSGMYVYIHVVYV